MIQTDPDREAADKKAAAERYQKLHAQGGLFIADKPNAQRRTQAEPCQARRPRPRLISPVCKKSDVDEKPLPPNVKLKQMASRSHLPFFF